MSSVVTTGAPAPAPAELHDAPLVVGPVQLDQIIEQSPIGIAVIDLDGIWRSVNPAYCTLYGYRRDELLGRSFTLVFAAAQRASVLARHQRFLREGGKLNGEWSVTRRDGAVFNISSESVRVPAGDGQVHRLVYVIDMTERRRHEVLLRDLTASIPGVLFRLVISPARLGRFVYMSAGIETLFELTPEQVCADIQALRRCILPEDLAAHDAAIAAVLDHGDALELDYRIRSARSGELKWVQARSRRKADVAGDAVWTGVLSDITAHKRVEAELRASEETYRTLFETVPQGVVYHDAQGRITSANPAAERILGLSLAQMQGLVSIDARWHAVHEDGSPFPGDEHPAMVALRTGLPVHNVVMGVAVAHRGDVWIMVNATPLFKQGRLEQVYASFEDITQRVLMARELRRQASTDALTGAANRRALMERLKLEFDRLQRHRHLHCCVVAIDLDHFKLVNDQHGHAAGDAVLAHVTTLMRQGTRQVDLVARSGGEEFTLLLPDTPLADAQRLAERLRGEVEQLPAQVGALTIGVTLSLGVSALLISDITADEVLARADRALYAAKAGGRNRVCVDPDVASPGAA